METTTRSIPKRRKVSGGIAIESLLEFAAVASLVVGVFASGWSFMVFRGFGRSSAGVTLVGSLVLWLLFRAAAEVIRLLKRSVGVEHAGKISGPYEDIVATCGNCGEMLHSDVCCDSCGARIVRDAESDEEGD